MAQHDYIIDNGSGATVRADINDALAAIKTTNAGASAPSTPAAGMLWLDTNTPSATEWTLNLHDGTDWISVATVDATNNIFRATSSVAKAGDTMTGALVLPASDPTGPNDAARKAYVDARLLKAGDTMTGALVLPASDPTADDQAARKKYVDDQAAAKSPLPTASSGAGQWVHVNTATGAGYTLPSGGTWAWSITAWNQSTSPAGTLANTGAGVSAGGTTIGVATANLQWRGFAWRIA